MARWGYLNPDTTYARLPLRRIARRYTEVETIAGQVFAMPMAELQCGHVTPWTGQKRASRCYQCPMTEPTPEPTHTRRSLDPMAKSQIVKADDGTAIGRIERTNMEPLGTVWNAYYTAPDGTEAHCGGFGGGDDDAANQRRAAAAVQAIHTRRHRLSID